MGNGVELEDIKPKEKKKKEAMYQVSADYSVLSHNVLCSGSRV